MKQSLRWDCFPQCDNEVVQNLLRLAICRRDAIADKRRVFKQNLDRILTNRDITLDKLRNASSLKIEIPKFSGNGCSMDFYTFKTEFQKLIEPSVQKKYRADYLKRNYLTDQALPLVGKEKYLLRIFGCDFRTRTEMPDSFSKTNWKLVSWADFGPVKGRKILPVCWPLWSMP